jgi:hypothetical protein
MMRNLRSGPVLFMLMGVGMFLEPRVVSAQNSDLYSHCTFYPQAPVCEKVYQQALTDPSPGARSVQAAYLGYARYLKNANGSLTDEDRQYLQRNFIDVPDGLSLQDIGGLHNVINDPALQNDPDARVAAVNNFINRAIEAELYCGLNSCENYQKASSNNRAHAPSAGPANDEVARSAN